MSASGAADLPPADLRKISEILESWHSEAVLDLPGTPLPYHPAAALWGARLLFHAACLIAFREMERDDITRLLTREPMPDAANPAAHFSADLCLRHWAALSRMARATSENDPLVEVMHGLVDSVPLSAPGLHLAVNHPVLEHAGLRQMFAERALERSDTTCLAIPEITRLLHSKLGSYATELGKGLLPATIP